MLRCVALILGLLLISGAALAEKPPAVAPGVPRSETLKPVAVYDRDGNVTSAVPFARNGKAFALPVSTTPQTYEIVQPDGAPVYRGLNLCPADIVIASVSVTAPVTTQAVTFGGKTLSNVRLVTSATGAVNEFEDTVFMARSGRVLGSSSNPMGGQTRYVSIMALADLQGVACAFRLHYGNGN
ncbi:hypothetical protein [Methylobacterium brachythecii]|uniref:Uncharacterized protein n=1 Tax=Methylobacterium brachythecii TaxID=1176177 RepID=A0A7W6AQV3_9HYPH|nr:hypothetical protein [Methylobacterium brachythecii]MBB3904187.1 hypothetical protein [Methylobacterium brachythecii]GLS45151.1 hypothetical protein GCM10007884_31400 [Methylobacterium brachythecii]